MTFKMTGESRTITVYNFRADTCEFIGKGDALIPAFTGLPACCTSEKPRKPETDLFRFMTLKMVAGLSLKTTGVRLSMTPKQVMRGR